MRGPRRGRRDRLGPPVREEWGQVVATLIELIGNWDPAGRDRRCHATAPDAAATDRGRIADLYEALTAVTPSPVVELNRAVAMADGIPAGLTLVDALASSGDLDGCYLLPATRADLLRRGGRRAEARASYEQAPAPAPAPTEAERRYLAGRLGEL